MAPSAAKKRQRNIAALAAAWRHQQRGGESVTKIKAEMAKVATSSGNQRASAGGIGIVSVAA